jgi:branched-chain amino acid aminotransferase
LPCPVDAAILVWEWGAYLGAEDALEKGVDVGVSSWTRSAPNTFPALAKASANYANSQLIKMEAIVDGYSEGIALDTFGYLSEGSGQNLFLVRDGVIYTPPSRSSILPGITRDSVITLARDLGYEVRERCCRARCSTSPTRRSSRARRSRSRRSVGRQDHGRAGPRGPVTAALQEAFFDIINGDAPTRTAG